MTSATSEHSLYFVLEGADSQQPSISYLLKAMGCPLEVAHATRGALELVTSSRRFTGIVIDAELPDGAALDVLARIRDSGIYTPTLLLAHPDDSKTRMTAQCHGAYLLPKPICQESLAAFVHWTKRRRKAAHLHLEEEVRALGHRHGLTPREQELVRLAASGVARHELMTALRVEESTIKTTVRRLLRKARRSTLSEVVSEVHRAVFMANDQHPPLGSSAPSLD